MPLVTFGRYLQAKFNACRTEARILADTSGEELAGETVVFRNVQAGSAFSVEQCVI